MDEHVLFFTNKRAIAVKFSAWNSVKGSAVFGIVGAFAGMSEDNAERRRLSVIQDPNYLLPMKGTFTIDYEETDEIFFKKGFGGGKIIFDCADGSKFTFKADKSHYFQEAMTQIEPMLGSKLKTNK